MSENKGGPSDVMANGDSDVENLAIDIADLQVSGSEQSSATTSRRRFASVDTLRGVALAQMVLTEVVARSGGFGIFYHAEWDGLTFGDTVLPAFLVTSGLGLSFMLQPARKRAIGSRFIRRSLLLFLLGLLYNAYGGTWLDLSELRATGVLQMFAISGVVATAGVLMYRKLVQTERAVVLVLLATVVMVIYGVGLYGGSCEPVDECSPYSSLDIGIFGADHTYQLGSAGHDPEGLIASAAASAFVIYGYSAGLVLQRESRSTWWNIAIRLFVLGSALTVVGLAVSVWLPMNKRLMTPTYVLVTTGISLLAYCVLYVVIDARNARESREQKQVKNPHWTTPFVALGRNAILVYLLARVVYQSAIHIKSGSRSLETILLQNVIPLDGHYAEFLYSTMVLILILAITGVMHRRKVYLSL